MFVVCHNWKKIGIWFLNNKLLLKQSHHSQKVKSKLVQTLAYLDLLYTFVSFFYIWNDMKVVAYLIQKFMFLWSDISKSLVAGVGMAALVSAFSLQRKVQILLFKVPFGYLMIQKLW